MVGVTVAADTGLIMDKPRTATPTIASSTTSFL